MDFRFHLTLSHFHRNSVSSSSRTISHCATKSFCDALSSVQSASVSFHHTFTVKEWVDQSPFERRLSVPQIRIGVACYNYRILGVSPC